MKRFLAILPVLLLLGGCGNEDAILRKSVSEFQVLDASKERRLEHLNLTDPIYYLEVPDIGASVVLPDADKVERLRAATVLKIAYTFTHSMDYLKGDWVEVESYKILKVEDEVGSIIDLTICEIHGIQMIREALPVIYGLPTEEDHATYFRDIETHPHGMDVVFGGCVVPDPRRETILVFVCPSCREIFNLKTKAEQDAAGNVATRRP